MKKFSFATIVAMLVCLCAPVALRGQENPTVVPLAGFHQRDVVLWVNGTNTLISQEYSCFNQWYGLKRKVTFWSTNSYEFTQEFSWRATSTNTPLSAWFYTTNRFGGTVWEGDAVYNNYYHEPWYIPVCEFMTPFIGTWKEDLDNDYVAFNNARVSYWCRNPWRGIAEFSFSLGACDGRGNPTNCIEKIRVQPGQGYFYHPIMIGTFQSIGQWSVREVSPIEVPELEELPFIQIEEGTL